MKILKWVAIVLLVLAGSGYLARDWLLLKFISISRDLKNPIGPHQEVTWGRGPAEPTTPASERPPNIILILADDLGFNDVSLYGGGMGGGTVPTPNIDAIGHEGVTFLNGYSANGTCAPSRAAIMTGRYGTRFGFEFTPTPAGMASMVLRIAEKAPGSVRLPIHRPEADRVVEFDDMAMPPSEISIAEVLKARGYYTAHIGKWHLGRSDGVRPEHQGFDDSLLMATGLFLPEDDANVVNAKQDFDPIDQFLWAALKYGNNFNGGPWFRPGGYLTDYWTDEAVKVIEQNKNRPFFLYMAHWAVHTPLQALKADYDKLSHIPLHRERVYAAMAVALDRSVGRIMQALRDAGIDDNTLVVFTSDNGGAGYLGLPNVNQPYRGWKITSFEGGIHVPFAMRWPARIPAGQRFDQPVHGFDFFTTAARAAGATVPDDRAIDGVDLLPFVTGQAEGAPHEQLVWRQGSYQVIIRDGWKLHISEQLEGPEKTWLFHLENDPTERHDLSAEQPAKVAELRARLAAHNADQSPSAWPSVMSVPIALDKTLADPQSLDDEYILWNN